MDSQKPQQLQLLIESRDILLRNRALTLTLDEANRTTLGDLKLSLVPFPFSPLLLSSLFFSFNGKTLDDSSTVLSSLKVHGISTLILRYKLLGGGGDGGATGAESRDCYLNMYADKKPDKVDPNEKRLSRCTTCALSFEPLTPPCVLDRLGNVFNKEALVKSLLSKTLPREFRHIKGLKDTISLHLSYIPGLDSDSHRFLSHGVGSEIRFHCPITGLEFNGKYKFFALSKCGHVLSAKALKEVRSSSCLVCHQEFEESDKVVINGTDEEVAALRERMEEEKAARLKVKEKKQPRKTKTGDMPGNSVNLDSATRLSGKRLGLDSDGVEKPSVEIVNDSNGVLAAKGATVAPSKRFKAVDVAPPNANKQVYASIFTSSRKSDFKETFTCRSLPLGRN